MYRIGSDKQLFIDRRFVEASENVILTVNAPVKRQGVVLASDKPWDAFSLGWYSITEDEGVYKMWYHACDGDAWANGRWRLCYCISEDGLSWEKPNLGLVEYQGSVHNNIVLEDSKLAYVFMDPHGKADHRYKMVELAVEPQDKKLGIRIGTSVDGLQWERPSRNISKLPARWDTQKQAWWDSRRRKYVVYLRVMLGRDGEPQFPFIEPIESDPPVVAPKMMRPTRAVGRVEMDDILAPWPDENVRVVLAADENDPPGSDIYTHGLYQYPYAADAYFMFPMTYQQFREQETTVSNDGLNDTQFCASRNGIHWMRYDRKPYLPRGLSGGPDGGGIHGSEFHIR